MDRRHHSRSSPPGLAFVKIEPGMGGTMIDLSEGGLGFRVIMPLLDDGGPIKISFSLDANSLLEASGELAWSDSSRQNGGVRFTDIRDEVRRQLREFLDRSVPALGLDAAPEISSLPYLSTFTAQAIQRPTSTRVTQKSAPARPAMVATSNAQPASAEEPAHLVAPPVASLPPRRTVSMKPRTTPAPEPIFDPNIGTDIGATIPAAAPNVAPIPAAQLPPQVAAHLASISGLTGEFAAQPQLEAPTPLQTPPAPADDRPPGYQAPEIPYAGSMATGSAIPSDSLLGKAPAASAPQPPPSLTSASPSVLPKNVQEIRPSRLAPPAGPIAAQQRPEASLRAAAAASADVAAAAAMLPSAATPSSSLNSAADVTAPGQPTYTPPPIPPRPAAPSRSASPAASKPTFPKRRPAATPPYPTSTPPTPAPLIEAPAAPPAHAPEVTIPETTAAIADAPVPVITAPVELEHTTDAAPAIVLPTSPEPAWRAAFRTIVADPQGESRRLYERYLPYLPDELRNPQFVGKMVGGGVIAAFLALLLLTTFNYFHQARATASALPSAAAAQVPAPTTNQTSPDRNSAQNPASSTPAPDATSSTHTRPNSDRASQISTSSTRASANSTRTSEASFDRAPSGPLPSPQMVQSDTTGNAELQLARHYLSRQNPERNETLAVQWLWSAVAKNNAQADLVLAELYMRGEGVTPNCYQARVLLLAAANLNNAEAQRKLADLEQHGCPAGSAQN